MSMLLLIAAALRAKLTASVTNSVPYGSIAGAGSITTAPTTAVASGGSGAITYSWAYVSGDVNIFADSNTAATTTFTRTLNPVVGAPSAVWRCTITRGGQTATVDVTATCERIS